MSDGDNATPGRRRLPEGHNADNQWDTGTPRRTPDAAPWRRSDPLTPQRDDDTADTADEPTGNHTDGGISVADLIAKVTGDGTGPPERKSRRRAEPEPEAPQEPPAPPTEIIEKVIDQPVEPDEPVEPVAADAAAEPYEL
jgi:hypothetical protein